MSYFAIFPEIETERLRLRQLTLEDAPAILDEFSHPEVTKHIDPPPMTDLNHARQFLRWFITMPEKEIGWRWGIERKQDSVLIGTCGFHRWEQEHRRAEIGYDLRYDYWGQGYATEATRRMVQYGFEELSLHRIEADCNEENLGSAHVLEKAGFELEGIWRDRVWEKGRFVSLKQYAILAKPSHREEG